MNIATKWIKVTFAFCASSCVAISAWSAEGVFTTKNISYLSGGDSRPCAFFMLDGVTEAVASVPASPWFVLPKTHPQFKETFALLLSAKLSGTKVNVITTGGVNACGHAEVLSVGIP
jgi:hypothetical protein